MRWCILVHLPFESVFLFFSLTASIKRDYICDMGKIDETYVRLREAVERRAGRGMVAPRDFRDLSTAIHSSTGMLVSPDTLKRFWGYLGEKRRTKPFKFTLDAISKYAGYASWDSFAGNCNAAWLNSSDYILKVDLQAAKVPQGTVLELAWAPDRLVCIVSMGECMFRVLESRNSKLSVGDTFRTELFMEGEPLLLTNLVHEGMPQMKYLCGRVDGIRYRIVEEK